MRFLGTFLPDPTEVPAVVVAYVAQQLGIPDVTCLARYRTRDTHWDHVVEIQRTYGYRDFRDPREVFRLVRWLYRPSWRNGEILGGSALRVSALDKGSLIEIRS